MVLINHVTGFKRSTLPPRSPLNYSAKIIPLAQGTPGIIEEGTVY